MTPANPKYVAYYRVTTAKQGDPASASKLSKNQSALTSMVATGP